MQVDPISMEKVSDEEKQLLQTMYINGYSEEDYLTDYYKSSKKEHIQELWNKYLKYKKQRDNKK